MLTQSKNRGFSLVEVLIALFIFTIIALILTKALHSVIRTQTATEESAEQLAQMQTALLLLSRDLEQALERPITNATDTLEASFIGSPDSLSFTHLGFANPHGDAQSSHLQRSRYRSDNGQLFRDTWATLDRYQELPDSRQLISGVKQVSFRYLDDKKIFHSSWAPEHAASTLPRAVEITLRLESGGSLEQLYLLPQEQVSHAGA